MGQSKKKRLCPALNQALSPADCGAHRVSKYACPATCEHNLFTAGSYPALLDLEAGLDRKTITALVRHHADPHGFARLHAEARRVHGETGEHAAAMRAIFVERDGSSRTVAERWLQAEAGTLSNDEQTLLRAKMQARVALLEVRRVVDAQQLEAVDLLDDRAPVLTLIDRGLAGSAGRFTPLLVWIYPLPHFWRVSGLGCELPDVTATSPLEIIAACVRHLGGPAERAGWGAWLAANFEKVAESFQAIGVERQRRSFASADATFGVASYALEAPAPECLALLRPHPDVIEEIVDPRSASDGVIAVLAWLEPGSGGTNHRNLLGRMLFKPSTFRIDAMGGARLDDLKAKAQACLGSRIRFTAERRDDIAARMMEQLPATDPALVPPQLVENMGTLQFSSSLAPSAVRTGPDQLQQVRQAMLRGILQENVPALDGLTPPEAARRPELRPRVLEWAKGLIRLQDKENLRTGGRDELMNPLMRELGFHELDVEPPPLRPRPHDGDAPWGDGEEEAAFPGHHGPATEPQFTSDWSAPPLPPGQLTVAEALTRLQMAMHVTPTSGHAIDAIDASGARIMDEVTAILDPELNQDEIEIALALVAQLWFALVPRGQLPLLRYRTFADDFDRYLSELMDTKPPAETALLGLKDGSSQPNLLAGLTAHVLAISADRKHGRRIRPQATFAIILVLKLLLDELDRALRS